MLATILALVFVFALSTSAYAHVCSNQNKQLEAGSIGTLTLNLVTGEETFEPSGKKNGGFVTIHVITPWGDQWYSVFEHAGPEGILPDGALNAGPGDSLCDGKGVDFAIACVEMSAP